MRNVSCNPSGPQRRIMQEPGTGSGGAGTAAAPGRGGFGFSALPEVTLADKPNSSCISGMEQSVKFGERMPLENSAASDCTTPRSLLWKLPHLHVTTRQCTFSANFEASRRLCSFCFTASRSTPTSSKASSRAFSDLNRTSARLSSNDLIEL